jgi:hypothetical protein
VDAILPGGDDVPVADVAFVDGFVVMLFVVLFTFLGSHWSCIADWTYVDG